MTFSIVLTTRPLRDAQPIGSYRRDGKLYVSAKDNWLWRNGRACRLQPKERAILSVLGMMDRPMSQTDLFEHLYEDRSDGGPDDESKAVRQRLYKIKIACATMGLEITNTHGWGWRLQVASENMSPVA